MKTNYKHRAKLHHCNDSLHGFTTQANLNKRLKKGCMVEVGQRMEMPKEYEEMKFMHHFKEEKFPFVIYADLEGLTVPRDHPPRSEFKTEIYQVHTPCGYSI